MIGGVRDWIRRPVDDPREARGRKRILWLVLIDLVLVFVLVWLNLMSRQLGYRIDSTSRLIEKLDLEHSELMAEFSREASPERLRARARDELGLDLPAPGQVVAIDGRP